MSPLKASLLALLLAALPQAAPGGTDDLAELFPEDAMVFAEVTRIPDILRDWEKYAEGYLPPAKKKELIEKLRKDQQESLDKIPEKLRKDLERGLPTIQRTAAYLRMGPGGEPEWAVAAASSDPDLFKRIVDEDLKVFAVEEKIHDGVPVLLIRKLGDLKLEIGFLVAAAGRRLVVAGSWDVMTAALDRAAGKGKGEDLRRNPSYRALAAPGEAPTLRAFWSGMGSFMDMVGSMGMGRRSSAHEMDKVNALLGLDKIGGFLVEATLTPGKIASSARLQIGSPCPLYDLWRQPAGPKDLLKYVPATSPVVAHVNAKSGKAVWESVERLIRRHDEIEKLSTPPGEERRRGGLQEEMDREFMDNLGMKVADIFGAIGDEAVFALVGPDALAFDEKMLGAIFFAVKAADPAGAKDFLQRLVAKIGGYETKEEAGAVFYQPAGEAGERPVFALKDGVCLIGAARGALLAGLEAAKDGKHFAAGLPADAARASKLLALDFGGLWKAMAGKMGAQMPPEVRDLDFDAKALLMFEEKEGELVLRTGDGGAGLALQAFWLGVPAGLFFGRSVAMGAALGGDVELPDAAALPIVVAPPLPADQIVAKVKALAADLQADDVVKREEAAAGLRALGPQAAPAVAAAYKASSDAESRGRLLGQLVEWKAYDAMPEVLHAKVEKFLDGFRKPARNNDPNRFGNDMPVQWYRHEGMPWTYCMEPSWVNQHVLKATPHLDVLGYAAGARAAAGAVAGEAIPVEARRRIGSILAYVDCGKAGEALVAARDGAADAELKSYLQIALGWSDDAKCRKAVLDGLKDGDVWMRRSSFIAAERSGDAALVGRLLELLKDADFETRWNAAFTLRAITGRKISINVYAAKAEVDAAIAAAGAWWEANKAGFKPAK